MISKLCLLLLNSQIILFYSFNIADYTHYMDYIPFRQDGLAQFLGDIRTSPMPPSHIRNRKMDVSHQSKSFQSIEEVLKNPIYPSKWPYGIEDFRPLDYTRDLITNTLPQYQFSQSLLESGIISIIPGFVRLPINRHFILPKDKIALSDHLSNYYSDEKPLNILELFSCHESILHSNNVNHNNVVVGVGFYSKEMECNELLDDFIEQDITIDPYLPLQSNYFDYVVIPANFQLFQKPLEMFQEINRVLKPGGIAFVGLKLGYWNFLGSKQGRYYQETSYYEDIITLGSFFHYSKGYNKAESFDLTLPEVNIIGQFKDIFFPQPRLDFYGVVQAKKRLDSPHSKTISNYNSDMSNPIIGRKYQPKIFIDPITKEKKIGPFYDN